MFRGSLQSNAAMKDQQRQSIASYDSSVPVRPVHGAAWRGTFNIPSLNLNINIAAHVSKNSCSKVLEVARVMPASLHVELVPRRDAWPASFKTSPPTEHSVALVFFPEGSDDFVDNLLNHAICGDYALKSMIGEAELLIFTSLQLPSNLHRFQGKPYFWGVFRGQLAAPRQSDYDVHVKARESITPNSGNSKSSKRKGSPITISSENSSLTQSSKADRRGRRLDIAWEHAKPLDVLRQKAECRHCGFVSSHGGISRLKAHLGGGIPGIRLPGCDKVPPEFKKVMSEWFSEWLKNTKALWAKEVRGSAGHVAREHTKPLNVACQRTDCNFSSDSLPEGIPLHKAHLSGGDPNNRKEPRPQMLMSEWLKNLTPSTAKKSEDGGRSETRGRRLDDAWIHATPLDEIRQKTRCNYCGFVSQYGGISRLKAHLGGGCPQLQLTGCDQVPLEVKSVMEQWFNEWSKNSSASWIRKSHAASPGSSKRKRPLDDIWEHAIPLDETRQATKCKYCGFVSKYGGIARLKAHLAGGDPMTQLEGCPIVSPEIKKSMTKGIKNRKKSKGVPMESLGSVLQGDGRTTMEAQRSETRHHILQETLDEISNTSLKGRLQQMLEDKNAKLRKMQYEVQTLGMQLASIP